MRKKRISIFILSALFILLPFITPVPEGLTLQGYKALMVFVVCVVWWVTNVVPLMITSLLAIVLLPLLGATTTEAVYSKFGNTAIFFVIGSFILSAAFVSSGLSSRFTVKFLKAFGKSPLFLVLGFQYLALVMGFWMSGHAVAALLLPLVIEINENVINQKEGKAYSRSLCFSVMWGAVIGSMTTLLGGARGPLALAILEKSTGQTISFSKWILFTLPLVLIISGIATFILVKITPRNIQIERCKEQIEEKVNRLGSISRKEKKVLLVMIPTILTWVFLGTTVGIASIALSSTIALFVLKAVKWSEVERDVNWGVILMYGGAISLGYTLYECGVSDWLINLTLGAFSNTTLILLLLTIIVVLLTESMSNTAVVAFLMPVALSAALRLNINPINMVLVVTLPSGMAFMMPMSTPAVAMMLSTGYLELKDTVKYGIILNITGIILTFLSAMIYWPLMS